MSLATSLSGLLGAGTGTSLGKNLAASKLGAAQQSAIQGANIEAETEIFAQEMNKIKRDKQTKLLQLDGEERKNRLGVNEKNASQVQF